MSTPGVGEGVEQRRLAGVGVADDRHRGEPAALALLALQVAGALELLEVVVELADPPQDPPTVDLEARLAATEAHADAAALLGESGRGSTPQPWQAVAQQRQLDLRASFEGVGVLGEDVEDHRRAVDGGAAEQTFEVVLLRRRQLVVEHDGVGVDLEAQLAQLLGLALADEPGAVRRVAPLGDAGRLVGAGRVDERGELVEAGLGLLVGHAGKGDTDEHDALTEGALDERRAEGFGVGAVAAHGWEARSSRCSVVGPLSDTVVTPAPSDDQRLHVHRPCEPRVSRRAALRDPTGWRPRRRRRRRCRTLR